MAFGLRLAVIICVAALAVGAPMALHAADEDDDHDLARDLHEGGEIRALSGILRDVARSTGGEVVAVDLVRARDRWLYRIQVVTPDGRRSLIEVDAGKGTVFHDEERD